jgi:glyceraldehyde 3-phosphate dehydrogenase
MANVAINGFGRIGRTFLRMAIDHPDFDIVAVNDLGDVRMLAYLLQYDTPYGRAPFAVTVVDGGLMVGDKKITVLSERDPAKLPWGDLKVDIVVEATGIFNSYEKSKVHLTAGAKKVVITGPVKDNPADSDVVGATVLMGINHEELKTCQITSNASCTTNATSPLIGILKDAIGIKKAILNTVHAYTATQTLVDGPSKKDFREGRAAAQNIIPSATGAAHATALAHPELAGKFDGISIRVPVVVGSIVDVTFIASRTTSVEEVNATLTEASKTPRWSHLFAVTNDPIVSSDIIGARYASIADLAMTRVVDGDLVKVLAWYDNETSFTHTLVAHVAEAVATL